MERIKLMDVWVRDDMKNWGQMFGKAFQHKGHTIKQFTIASDIVDAPGIAFMLQHHNRRYRETGKQITKRLSQLKHIKMIPSHKENYLFDDKVAQFYELWPYMPTTCIFAETAEADNAIERIGFPFISKSAQGASAKNVDLISTQEEADCQVDLAFGDGIPRHYGLKQYGYLLWQRFLPDNPYGYKVIMLANMFAVIVKCTAEPNDIFHSSSPLVEVQTQVNDELVALLEFCSFIVTKHKLSFVGFDIIYDQQIVPKKPTLLEISTGWTIAPGMLGCTVFERTSSGSWAQTCKHIECEQDMFDLLPTAFDGWDFTNDFIWPEYSNG